MLCQIFKHSDWLLKIFKPVRMLKNCGQKSTLKFLCRTDFVGVSLSLDQKGQKSHFKTCKTVRERKSDQKKTPNVYKSCLKMISLEK